VSHERYQEWIELAIDGELGAAERAELDRHLAACGDCRAEVEHSRWLVAELAAAAIAPRPAFTAEVMAALAPAAWEARAPRAWKLPLAALVVVGGAASILVGIGSVDLGAHAGAGALFALVDLFRAAFVAGSGLAVASWKAAGDALGAWLGGSVGNWAALAGLVVGANYLLYRLVRGRPAEAGARLPRRR
jgi:anti-sigma factor RsiW